MNDERLAAGRHHLDNGHRAIDLGYPDEARAFFDAALLQFRGPELRVGEAHAYRGLAQVELTSGDATRAEKNARQAIACFEELQVVLDDIEDVEAIRALRRDAYQGEAAARIVLAEVLTRTGRSAAARAALDSAREVLDQDTGGATAGAVWMSLGRLSLRSGEIEEARQWFEKALQTHREEGDDEGRIAALLLLAEQGRLSSDLQLAEESLQEARRLAKELDHERWEGRVLIGLGALAEQAGRYFEARSFYEDAVEITSSTGELDRKASALVGLGSTLCRLRDVDGFRLMFEGAELYSSTEHSASLASALYRIASAARRARAPELALASAEGARRLWGTTDGLRGQSMALRHIVKALAALKAGRGALAAAIARERLGKESSGNAAEVASWFRERAPADLLADLDALDTDRLLAEARIEAERLLGPMLEGSSCKVDDLGVPTLAIAVIRHISETSSPTLPKTPASASAGHLMVAPTEPDPSEVVPTLPKSPDVSPPRLANAPTEASEDVYASLYGDD
ncbi:MAG: tetratricopeptide repeat protein [Deltaproteobacteria bacterium]|nr:MAG: tetratricopeptide repeat protein [Deltaproteobacteria bacterium]